MAALTAGQRDELTVVISDEFSESESKHPWNYNEIDADVDNCDAWHNTVVESGTGLDASLSLPGQAATKQQQRLLYWYVSQKRFDEGVSGATAMSAGQRSEASNALANKLSNERESHPWSTTQLLTDVENADEYIRTISESLIVADGFYVAASTVAQGATALQRLMFIWQTTRKRWQENP